MADMGSREATYVKVLEHSGNRITFRFGVAPEASRRQAVPQAVLFLVALLLVLVLAVLLLRA